jgi:hypothetical protein
MAAVGCDFNRSGNKNPGRGTGATERRSTVVSIMLQLPGAVCGNLLDFASKYLPCNSF